MLQFLLSATLVAQVPACYYEDSKSFTNLTELCRKAPEPEKPQGLVIDRYRMAYERGEWRLKVVVRNPTDKTITFIRVGYEVPKSPRNAIGSANIARLEPGQSFEATGQHQPKTGGQGRVTSLEYLIRDENRVVRERF